MPWVQATNWLLSRVLGTVFNMRGKVGNVTLQAPSRNIWALFALSLCNILSQGQQCDDCQFFAQSIESPSVPGLHPLHPTANPDDAPWIRSQVRLMAEMLQPGTATPGVTIERQRGRLGLGPVPGYLGEALLWHRRSLRRHDAI